MSVDWYSMQSFKQLYLNKSIKKPKAGYNRINNVLWKSTVIKGTVTCITQLNFSSIPFIYSNRMYMCGSELNFEPSLYKHTPCCQSIFTFCEWRTRPPLWTVTLLLIESISYALHYMFNLVCSLPHNPEFFLTHPSPSLKIILEHDLNGDKTSYTWF